MFLVAFLGVGLVTSLTSPPGPAPVTLNINMPKTWPFGGNPVVKSEITSNSPLRWKLQPGCLKNTCQTWACAAGEMTDFCQHLLFWGQGVKSPERSQKYSSVILMWPRTAARRSSPTFTRERSASILPYIISLCSLNGFLEMSRNPFSTGENGLLGIFSGQGPTLWDAGSYRCGLDHGSEYVCQF